MSHVHHEALLLRDDSLLPVSHDLSRKSIEKLRRPFLTQLCRRVEVELIVMLKRTLKLLQDTIMIVSWQFVSLVLQYCKSRFNSHRLILASDHRPLPKLRPSSSLPKSPGRPSILRR